MKVLRLVLFLALCSCTLEKVGTGEAGIVFDDSEAELLDRGEHYVPVHKRFVKLDISEQRLDERVACLSRDDKDIQIAASIIFQPIKDEVLDLYTSYGQPYQDRLVIPEFRAAIRAQIQLVDRDSLNAGMVKEGVINDLDTLLRKRHIKLTDVTIKVLTPR